MNPYAFLAIAILSEVFGSSMLKVSNGFKGYSLPWCGYWDGFGFLLPIVISNNHPSWNGLCHLVGNRHSFNCFSGSYRL